MPTNIAPEHHVVRHVAKNRLKRHDDGTVYGCFPEAFLMRDNEGELSVSWLEYFQAERRVQLEMTAAAMKACGLTIRSKDGLAVANVGAIKEVCGQFDVKVRVLHEPAEDNPNPAYASIRHLPRDNHGLLALIASGCVEIVVAGDLE
jgi:hypothetical protein